MANKPFTIAVAGKGGVGKTSISAGIIQCLRDRDFTPILAVDADPNSTLADALGIEVEHTIAQILDDSKDTGKQLPPGMDRHRYIEERFQLAIVEDDRLDMFVMGHPGGPGCYCAPNSMLRGQIEKLSPNYKAVVLDNEAGMEHISRRTSREVDLLLFVAEPAVVGVRAAGRIQNLARDLKLSIGAQGLIVNRCPNGLTEKTLDEIAKLGLNLLGVLPANDEIARRAIEGEPLASLPADNEWLTALGKILDAHLPK